MPAKTLNGVPVKFYQLFRPYISDTNLAKVAGVTYRQLVQVLGPRTDREAETLQLLRQGLDAGLTIGQIFRDWAGDPTVTQAQLSRLARKHGLKRDQAATLELRREDIRRDLRAFIATGLPFTQYGIEYFSHQGLSGKNLWVRMRRVSPRDDCSLPPVTAWAQEMGITRPPPRSQRILKKEPPI